jgi:hypothetical protein
MSDIEQADAPLEDNLQFSNGTLDGAALDIANIDLDTGETKPPRDDKGRFTARNAANDDVADDDAREPLANGHDPAPDDDEDDEPIAAQDDDAEPAEGDDDQDWIELPGENEGDEPTRLALQDVVDGYNRSKELQTELENVKTAAPPPVDYEQQVDRMLGQYRELGKHIQDWQMANPVRPPAESMINPASPDYNPELYYAQLEHARSLHQQHQHAKQALEAAQAEEQQHMAELERTRWAREEAKIFEAHPHLKAESERLKLAADLEAEYGIDVETLQSIRDSRAFNLMIDALAHRKSQKATDADKAKVAKAVRAKPKLVRQTKGRDSAKPQQRRAANAMKNLQRSGSLDDAADVIANLDIL